MEMRYLNISTLRQETESNLTNIIDSDKSVKNWFKPKPEGFTGEWIDGTYTFVKIPAPTKAEIALEKQQVINLEAKKYLHKTDWYVGRLNDPSSGKAIPQDILNARASARESIIEE
jgi:hypothetical protein